MTKMNNLLTAFWAVLALTVGPLSADQWDDARAAAQVIDRNFADAQREAGIAPSPLCSDAEFLRRVTLDLTGRVPDIETTEAFLSSTRLDKRQHFIDQLMQTDEYREGWATTWTLWLLGRNPRQQMVDRSAFLHWVRDDVIANNMPHDEFVRELLTTDGRSDENPPTNYLLQFEREPANAAGMVSRHFLGQQIQCAQCHDHMEEPLTQEDFWGMTAFFNQTQQRPIREEGNRQPVAFELVTTRRARETTIPNTDTVIPPTYLDGTSPVNRNLRAALASKITAPDNPDFPRATVNRLWAHFFGRGFVEPIDDFRASNPTSYPGLLDYLANDFREHGCDREHLIRSIVLSDTYQRSSIPTAANADDDLLYTHARLRPLSPEQLFWSLVAVTGAEPQGTRAPRQGRDGQPLTREERVERVVNQFIVQHSDDEQGETSLFEGTIPLSLMMMNSPQIAMSLTPRFGPSMREAVAERDPREVTDMLYLAALSRHPTDEEIAIATSHLSRPGVGSTNRVTLTQDLLWALINTSEFMFNH